MSTEQSFHSAATSTANDPHSEDESRPRPGGEGLFLHILDETGSESFVPVDRVAVVGGKVKFFANGVEQGFFRISDAPACDMGNHSWSRWSDQYLVIRNDWSMEDGYRTTQIPYQRHSCMNCGLLEERRVTSSN